MIYFQRLWCRNHQKQIFPFFKNKNKPQKWLSWYHLNINRKKVMNLGDHSSYPAKTARPFMVIRAIMPNFAFYGKVTIKIYSWGQVMALWGCFGYSCSLNHLWNKLTHPCLIMSFQTLPEIGFLIKHNSLFLFSAVKSALW